MIYIIQSAWNRSITDALARGSESILQDAKVEFKKVLVPGALEIGLAAQWLYEKNPSKFQGAIACACVIKGDTYHFDIVANESARALTDLSLKISRPLTNAILCVYRIEDAQARASASNNKGAEAASTLLEMIKLQEKLESKVNQ